MHRPDQSITYNTFSLVSFLFSPFITFPPLPLPLPLPPSAPSCFADVNLEEENITEEGYAFYRFLRDGALKPVPIPHICVYLDAAAQLCLDRVNSRNRGCESGIPVAYLEKLGKVRLIRLMHVCTRRCAASTLHYILHHTINILLSTPASTVPRLYVHLSFLARALTMLYQNQPY